MNEHQSLAVIKDGIFGLPHHKQVVFRQFVFEINEDTTTNRISKHDIIDKILSFERFLQSQNLRLTRREIIYFLKHPDGGNIKFDWNLNTMEQYCSVLSSIPKNSRFKSPHIGIGHYQAVSRKFLTTEQKIRLLSEYHEACERGFYHDTPNTQSIIVPDLDELRRRAKALNDLMNTGEPDPPEPDPPKHENFTIEHVEPSHLEQGLAMFGYETQGILFDNKPATVYIRVVYTE